MALSEAISQTDGDRVAAAGLLGLEMKELRGRLAEYGL